MTWFLLLLTLILTFFELDYGFKIHDLMLMGDFMMFRRILECWNLLENIGMLLRNKYGMIGKKWEDLVSWRYERRRAPNLKLRRLGWEGVLDGATSHSPYFRDTFFGALRVAASRPLPRCILTFLARFSTINLLIISLGSFPKYVESITCLKYERFNLKSHLITWIWIKNSLTISMNQEIKGTSTNPSRIHF